MNFEMAELTEHPVHRWPWVVCVICAGSGFLRDERRHKRRGVRCWGCAGGGAQHLARVVQALSPLSTDGVQRIAGPLAKLAVVLLEEWQSGAGATSDEPSDHDPAAWMSRSSKR